MIVARGYADTRIADVAEHAGISPALVIYYFKTRDQLLTEALRYSEDAWYAAGTQRLAAIATAVGRLTELIAMTCLPDTDPAARTEWLLWLDLWALSPRNPGVATVRRKFDERWRETISSTVLSGQESGEFSAAVDAAEFAVTLSALLDGMAVQIALEDPDVPPSRAYDLAMRYAAGQLGFTWDWSASGRPESTETELTFMAAGIELVGLTKRFGHGAAAHAAVDNIDLSVAGGEFFSLLGPSGCGKTTTLRLIAGLKSPPPGAFCSTVPTSRRCRRTSGMSTRCSSRTRCSRSCRYSTTWRSGSSTAGVQVGTAYSRR